MAVQRYARLAADLVGPWGRVRFPAILTPYGFLAMRAVVAVLLFVTTVHAALWGVFRDKQEAPDFKGILPSVSYAPFEGTSHPDVDNIPNAEKIRADLKKLAPLTRAIRLYSSTGGVELVPPIAAEFGLKVTVGAWIDKNVDRNEREIDAAINLAKRNSNVIGVVVGNETVYRGEQKVDDLIGLVKKVKKSVNVPVTTGEIWNIWRDNPELASSVDFIAAHILPYWENFTDKQAVDQAVYIYGMLRDKFPGKRIVIAEFGWPSAGYNLKNAVPGPFEQAAVLRNFVTRAESIGMEYNIVEAIDQPWKFFEGGVGPYWGILNAARGGHREAVAYAVGGRQRHRGVDGYRVRVLDRPLLRVRLGLRVDAGTDPAGSAGADRDGADRGDRRHCLRPKPAPPACKGAIDRAGRCWQRGVSSGVSKSLDPCAGLFRAARDAQADARCGGPAGLSEFRMRRDHQQHPRSGIPAADPGSLPRARGTFQVHQRREDRRLQGRRLAHRHGTHRRGCRDHRHHRCRLCRAAGLAEGSGAGVRRSPRWPRAGAAGSSRRQPFADALHHERRICRVLRHRHGPAQRGQRHHRPRHHVPDPARGDGHGRRLERRHHLRGHRSGPCDHRARLAHPLHQPPLRPWPAAGHL